ncbi:SLC13 family permease [Zeimonas arvi]|uniref:SLC13 family permease n=1 Tax=Zeimonas arvi TaxID=2498847 RepID=A0A5C8NXF3_9BURK|nr:SLC13 family permease [Zeimonas arvi]TXL65967.1 SLC13 family permease [Zeimonas arvi]
MTWEQALVLISLVALIVVLVRGRIAPAVAFSGIAFAYYVVGLISLESALAQFTNTALVTVVLLLLLSIALDKSRLLELVADRLLAGPYRWVLFKIITATAVTSGFVNNTAVVATLIGPLRSSSRHPASRLLIPMSYAATVGGVLTLIGTSTNLLIDGFLTSSGLPGLSLFQQMPLGFVLLATVTLLLVITGPRLLPRHDNKSSMLSDYFLEAEVQPASRLIGRTVWENGLRNLNHLFLAEIVRRGELIAPVEPSEVLVAGDLLVFSGDVRRIDVLAPFDGLLTHGHKAGLPVDNLVEVLVTADSMLVHRTVKEAEFRSRFDAAVIAVRRGPSQLAGAIGTLRLRAGDTLVLATGPDFEKRNNLTRNFIIISRPSIAKFSDWRKSAAVVAAFVAVVAGAAAGWFDFVKGLLVLLAAFLLTRLLTLGELRRNAPFSLLFIIPSALIVSKAMFETGSAQLLARAVLAVCEPFGPLGALIGVLLLTALLTELMTNNAAAALAFPIAIGTAQQLGTSHLPFAMAVLFGASASFITPYGYQTNLMVMSPGGYTLRDYLRAGVPVSALYLTGAAVLIPVFFPL